MPFDPKKFEEYKKNRKQSAIDSSKEKPSEEQGEQEVESEDSAFGKAVDYALSPEGAATIGGIGAGIATGGMGLLPASLITGAAAGGGAAFGEIAETLRGRGPDTFKEGVQEVGESAARAAISNLAVGGAFKALGATVPVISQMVAKIPRVAFLRALERPQALKGFTFSLDDLGPDQKGMKAVAKLWDSFHSTRKAIGQEVDSALVSLGKKSEGIKVYLADIADEAEEVIKTASANDPKILDAVKKSDSGIDFIEGLISKIRGSKSNLTSPSGQPITSGIAASLDEVVSLRKAVDAMTDFAEGSEVASSAPSQLALRKVGAMLRDKISEIAQATGDDTLLLANRKYKNILSTGNEMSALFPIKKDTKAAVGLAWESFNKNFLRGGWRKDLLEEISSRVSGGSTALNEAMDASTAKAFTKVPEATPSGIAKDFIRALLSPQIASVALRSAATVRELTKAGIMAGQFNSDYDHTINPKVLEND